MGTYYRQRIKQKHEELDRRRKARLMAYGTYVLWQWWVKYATNKAEEKQYEYMGMPISLRMR